MVLQNCPPFFLVLVYEIVLEDVQRPRVCLWANHEADFYPALGNAISPCAGARNHGLV